MKTTARRTKGGSDSRFAQIPSVDLPRSAFDRSKGNTTTFDSAYLVPLYADEALPGDTVKLRTSGFVRMATPLRPVMDNLYVDMFFFAVPKRLLWDKFQRFMGEQPNPGDSIDFQTPISTAPGGFPVGYQNESLQDYLGLPTRIAGYEHNTFHLRAYNLIWNEWFRDENLQDSVVVDTGDGPDDPLDYVLLRRNKRHDYFTASLPFPQKGPSVPLPLGTSAPLSGVITAQATLDPFPTFIGSGQVTAGGPLQSQNTTNKEVWHPSSNPAGNLQWENPHLEVDLSGGIADLTSATAATINTIRTAFQIQKLYERDARGGTRYTEIVRSHFGVISPDARLQRPEYLGGGSSRINIHPVAVTADSGRVTGDLAGFVTAGLDGMGFNKSFTEHCVILGLASVRADLRYQQGLPRMYSRRSRFDYYWPSFAHLGEQEVLNKEIYTQGTSTDDLAFGYQERYGEYRYAQSIITGKMRSNDAASLDIWHVAQDFGSLPVLNSSFIEEDPPIDRVIAVPSEPQFVGDFWFSATYVRPMPTFGVPGLVDHF